MQQPFIATKIWLLKKKKINNNNNNNKYMNK